MADVEKADAPVRPSRKGEVGLYLPEGWYLLTFKDSVRSADPVEGLDVSILQDNILSPVLGIGDPRVDPRIRFVGGSCTEEELAGKAGETD